MDRHGGEDAVVRSLEQVPDNWATDAKAQQHEAIYPQTIHQAELVVGEAVPGAPDLRQALRRATFRVTQIQRDDPVAVAEDP